MPVRQLPILLVALAVIADGKMPRKTSDSEKEDMFPPKIKKSDPLRSELPTRTERYPKPDSVIEKFVNTLMNSEKYLRLIETIDKKLNHLDVAFHERSGAIVKYLGQIEKMVRSGTSATSMESALRTIKTDLGDLKENVLKKKYISMANMASMANSVKRAKGGRENSHHASKPLMDYVLPGTSDPHLENILDGRLGVIEAKISALNTGVDTLHGIVSDVKGSRTSTGRHYAVSNTETVNLISEIKRTIQEQRAMKCDCSKVSRAGLDRYPSDCFEIQMQGFNVTGIYKIKTENLEPFYVLCELGTTDGGGWTVFQNRFDGSQDFYKNWWDYKQGFGNLAGEFWLGLDKVHSLTNQKLYELRIEMATAEGQEAYAVYSVFTLGPDFEGYRISTLGSYYGNAGDSLSYHAGQKFSAIDVDNDDWKEGACSAEHGGAWWYKECDKSNLNGKFSPEDDAARRQSMYWITFKGPSNPLSKTKMMIRPLPATKPASYSEKRIQRDPKVQFAPEVLISPPNKKWKRGPIKKDVVDVDVETETTTRKHIPDSTVII